MVHQRNINPIWERSHRFLWRTMIQVILRNKSWSVIPIRESEKCLLPQSAILGFRIQNPATDWNPESQFHWQGIRFLGSGILSLESRIQDCHGLPCTGAILTYWIITTEPYSPSRPFLSRHETKTSTRETNRNPCSLSYVFQIKHEIITSNQLRKAYKCSRFGFFDLIFKEVELLVSLDRCPLQQRVHIFFNR